MQHRSYFDGFGRVYREVSPDATGVAANATVQISAYDGRGNLAWKSIPLPVSATSASAAQRSAMLYDGQNRQILLTNPDGSNRETRYSNSAFSHYGGPTITYPVVITYDEDYDAVAKCCGEYMEATDAQGRRIRQLWWDRGLTDTDAGTTIGRVVNYRYSGKGGLTQIITESSISWAYGYDLTGNRISASDPGLGSWTMAYDVMGNLIRQTDAKGQVMTFTYDFDNRLTRKQVTGGVDGTQTTVLDYGDPGATGYAAGRLISQSRGEHTIAYTYLPGGQIGTERHRIDDATSDRSFTISRSYAEGFLKSQTLPSQPGGQGTSGAGVMAYDGAGRVDAITQGTATYIASIAYNRWGQPTETVYGNGARDIVTYHGSRGWPVQLRSYEKAATSPATGTDLTRSASGRITRQNSEDARADFDYSYDYAGRLLSAANFSGQPGYSQSFDYDRADRMVVNSRVGSYTYGSSFPRHAPKSLALAGGGTTSFTYDANGNMTRGLDGKVMTYDGENRPLSVTLGGKTTSYVYGADGTRLKKIEIEASGAQDVTAYFGHVEIRHCGKGSAEEVVTYPHPNLRLVNGQPSYLHRDRLGSIRAVTGADGLRDERSVYRPLGEQTEWKTDAIAPAEDKGFIGERYDADAGLQYLNARYYDPKLALFIQPDWFEVAKPGVGTNRFAYSFNDPVNKRDPGGNAYTGETLATDKDEAERALDAADRDRQLLESHIDKARIAKKRLEAGQGFGLFSGLAGFKQRIESSYGEMSVETLDRFSAEAKIVADWIEPRGKGARIESLAVYEGALIAKGLRGKELERAMVKQFGPRKFTFDGISTSFAGRYKGATAWAKIGGHEILHDYGFSGQTRVVAP